MSEERVVYSVQQTYIINTISTPEKSIITCDQRIDIPTIEPLPGVKPVVYKGEPLTVIPCIELACEFLSEFNLTFETNEGVTVLPIKIVKGGRNSIENPYTHFRYVLVLPRGATGVKSCKLIRKDSGKEVQHNFTFGIMPPPYNYDNALFGDISYYTLGLLSTVEKLSHKVDDLRLTTKTPVLIEEYLRKGVGKQTINIQAGVLFYETEFSYPLSSEPTIHKPKITLHGEGHDQVYTLSLNKTNNVVSIDLFTGMIRVCDVNGEIIQQFMLLLPFRDFETLSFENFDDIDGSVLHVIPRGARVK